MLVTQRWERRFEAMGTDCHVVVVGAPRQLTAQAEHQVRELQQLWTRFEPDSEVMRLNRVGTGVVSPATWGLITRGLVGRRFTAGRFDPFMATQIVAAGYDRTFAELTQQRTEQAAPALAAPVVALDRRTRQVRRAAGAQFDSGGIGKGLAADLVSAQLMESGADACLVNLGGDLRVRGDKGSPWQIGVDNEAPQGPALSVKLAAGGLATSSRMGRRWKTDQGPVHHLLDPRTGRSMRTRWAGATAIAPQAWVAEVLSKALLQLDRRAAGRLMRHHHGGGFRQAPDGTVEQV